MDLLTEELERLHQRLRVLGWAACPINETTWWRMPGSDRIMTEEEAEKWLQENAPTQYASEG